MVGEFPELQGVIGGYLARAQGEPPAVADAIRDHYKPVGQGDEVPTAPVTVAVSLADKLDTLVAFFASMNCPPDQEIRSRFGGQRSAIIACCRQLAAAALMSLLERLISTSAIADHVADDDRLTRRSCGTISCDERMIDSAMKSRRAG